MKKGIALLELIFSIVIMAIALISVPNLMYTTTKASRHVVTQESISNASSYVNMIMSAFWDENCTDPRYNNPILYTSFDEEQNLKEYIKDGILMGRRVGSAGSTSRRYQYDDNGERLTASKQLKMEQNDNDIPDDIDDYNNREERLILRSSNPSIEDGDYKDTRINLSTTVEYINDKADNSYNERIVEFNNPFDRNKIIIDKTTNIKLITLTLESENDPDKQIVLKSFSCNIGSGILTERIFPATMFFK